MLKIITFLSLSFAFFLLGFEYQAAYIGSVLLSLYAFALYEERNFIIQNKEAFKSLQKRYQKVKDSSFDFTATLTNGETKIFTTGPACLHNGVGDSRKSAYNDLAKCQDLFTEYNEDEFYSHWSIVDAKFSFEFQRDNKKVIKLMNGESVGVEALIQLHKTA